MNLVDKLLNVDKEAARKKKKGTFESGRMRELVGDGTIEIQSISERKTKRHALMGVDTKGNANPDGMMDAVLMMIVDGVTNPDLKNEKLQEHFGAATSKDLAEILFNGEAEKIADAIVALSEAEDVTKTVKN